VETGLSNGWLDLDVDPVDARSRRTVMAPVHEALDCRLGALEHGLDPPVGQVPNPSGHAESNGCLPARLAEPHALDATRHEHAAPDTIAIVGRQTWHAEQ
jgi:hypothetical protein